MRTRPVRKPSPLVLRALDDEFDRRKIPLRGLIKTRAWYERFSVSVRLSKQVAEREAFSRLSRDDLSQTAGDYAIIVVPLATMDAIITRW